MQILLFSQLAEMMDLGRVLQFQSLVGNVTAVLEEKKKIKN